MSHKPRTWVGRFPGIDGVITINTDAPPATTCSFDVPGGLRFGQQLEPVLPFSPEEFRARVGRYSDGDITVVVTMIADDTTSEPFPFYADLEHDAMVRLYPVAADRFLSEQGEELIFDADGALVLTVDDCTATLRRCQTQTEEEVSFLVSGTPTVLSGTLLRPAGTGPLPAVILAHASAWHHRDVYRAFAHWLVTAGVAVLIYDRQGHGSSTGDPDAALRTNAAGVEAAIDFLAERDDVSS
ncbi:MAG: alpha/beta hydrolase family protein, partial [Stackebrandtia sp.]